MHSSRLHEPLPSQSMLHPSPGHVSVAVPEESPFTVHPPAGHEKEHVPLPWHTNSQPEAGQASEHGSEVTQKHGWPGVQLVELLVCVVATQAASSERHEAKPARRAAARRRSTATMAKDTAVSRPGRPTFSSCAGGRTLRFVRHLPFVGLGVLGTGEARGSRSGSCCTPSSSERRTWGSRWSRPRQGCGPGSRPRRELGVSRGWPSPSWQTRSAPTLHREMHPTVGQLSEKSRASKWHATADSPR